MRAISFPILFTTLGIAACASAAAQTNRAPASAAPLPVREVTVFKDGHAFVLREGDLKPDADGRVVLERLPAPELGTFWPYAAGGAKVLSVTASKQTVSVEKTALDVRQLLEANVGKAVELLDTANTLVRGTIAGLPARDGTELARIDPAGGAPRVPLKGSVVLVRSESGTKAIPLDQVRNVTILGEATSRLHEDELRDRLTLRVAREGSGPARIGLVYVQKGLRWIPSYRIDIDGAGKARVRMEATLVNDLIDLEDATVHLVIGVPRFEFESMIDPISMQDLAARVASRVADSSRFSGYLSNAIMSQAAEAYPREPATAPGPAGPELSGGESNEDLYVFKLEHVTLREGERMVLPVTEFGLTYRDVYTLDVPFVPPFELRNQWSGDQRAAELARLLAAPKVVHALRLANGSSAPLTTAPALLLREGRVLSQALLAYTPIGAETDVPLATAVDVQVVKTEVETNRIPNAERWNNDSYSRTDLAGTVKLTNRKREAVDLEVRRQVLGRADSAGSGGAMEQLSVTDVWSQAGRDSGWGWWNWPSWWHYWNGVGRFTWKLRLEPAESVELESKWHYFWR